jgi:superkiller protein 3
MNKTKVILLILIGLFFSWAGPSYAGIIDDYFQNGYSQEEENCLAKALELAPENHGIYYALGIVYFKKGDYDKVIECHQKFTQLLKHDYYQAYKNLEAAYRKLGDYKKATEYSWKAGEYAKGYPPPVFNKEEDRNREIDALASALKIAPGMARIYLNVVVFFNAQNQEAGKEIEYIERAIQLDPENYGNYYGLGIAYYRKGDYDKAIDCFFRFTQNNPDCASTFYGLGLAYNSKQDKPNALAQVERLREIGRFELAEELEAIISGAAVDNREKTDE